jgi:hypothetical protein
MRQNVDKGKQKLICFGIFLQKSPICKLRILFQLKFPHCIIINQQTKTQRMAMENKTFDIALIILTAMMCRNSKNK